jgi:hypothetical protein
VDKSVKRPGSQNRTRARTPARPATRQSWLSDNRKFVIPAAIVLILLVVWLLWPSPYSKVANLDARGSNIVAFGDSLTAGRGAGKGED